MGEYQCWEDTTLAGLGGPGEHVSEEVRFQLRPDAGKKTRHRKSIKQRRCTQKVLEVQESWGDRDRWNRKEANVTGAKRAKG